MRDVAINEHDNKLVKCCSCHRTSGSNESLKMVERIRNKGNKTFICSECLQKEQNNYLKICKIMYK